MVYLESSVKRSKKNEQEHENDSQGEQDNKRISKTNDNPVSSSHLFAE